MGLISTLQMFDQVAIVGEQAPRESVITLAYFIYSNAFPGSAVPRIGAASAAAIVLAVFTMVLVSCRSGSRGHDPWASAEMRLDDGMAEQDRRAQAENRKKLRPGRWAKPSFCFSVAASGPMAFAMLSSLKITCRMASEADRRSFRHNCRGCRLGSRGDRVLRALRRAP